MARKNDDLIAHILTVMRNEFQAAERKLEDRDRKIIQRIKDNSDSIDLLRARMELLEARVTALENP